MNDQCPDSTLPRPIHNSTSQTTMNSDFYDPLQQMHIPKNPHQSASLHQSNIDSYFHHSQSNHNERNTPSFPEKFNFQPKYNQSHNHHIPPLCQNCHLTLPAPQSLYCHPCNNGTYKRYEENSPTNIPNTTNMRRPEYKPEYRPNFQYSNNNNPSSSLNYEEPLFKPLFEHPSLPSRPSQHNTFLPNFVPKIPPSLENQNFVYSSNITISSTVHQEMPNTYLPKPALSINNPRNAGRKFQYSGPTHQGHNDNKRQNRSVSAKYQHPYAEDYYQSRLNNLNETTHNQKSHSENIIQRRENKNKNQQQNFPSRILEPPKESHIIDLDQIEEFSFKKKKKKLKYDDVIEIHSNSPVDESPQMNLQGLLKSKKSTSQPEEDENSVNTLVRNLMKSNSEFQKRQEEQKKQEEEAEIAKKDEHVKELAEIISRKEEKIFKEKKPAQRIIPQAKFPKDIMRIINKSHKKKKEIRRDTDPLEKIFGQMRYKSRNPLKKTSSSHHPVKEKPLKSTSFLDDIINFKLMESSSTTIQNSKSPHIIARDRPRRPINSKRNFNELDDNDDTDERERLDYREKHFKSETFYEDNIGLNKPKKIILSDEEVNSPITLQSEPYESLSDKSQYFDVDGEKFGIILECYSNESDFADINEVKRKTQDFEVIGQNLENPEEIGDLLYPKKSTIHVGEAFQADIPMLSKSSSAEYRSFRRLWNPEKLDRESYDRFILSLSNLFGLSISEISEEKAGEILVDQNYNVSQALQFCSLNLEHVKENLCT